MDFSKLPAILTPDLGLLFWMLLAFAVVFFVLAKYGFPAIVNMVEERKKYIDESRRVRLFCRRLAIVRLRFSRRLLRRAMPLWNRLSRRPVRREPDCLVTRSSPLSRRRRLPSPTSDSR